MDRIQRRYGYTDDYVLALPYARFIQLARAAAEQSESEHRQRLRDRALFAYMANPPVDESGNVKRFDSYLRMLGLHEDEGEAEDPAEARERAEELGKRAREAWSSGAYREGDLSELQ